MTEARAEDVGADLAVAGPGEGAVGSGPAAGGGEGALLTFGPQHPALQGVLRLRLVLHGDGETIVDGQPLLGYGHRGMEKLFESFSLRDNVALTDRLDFVAAAAANLAYVGAVERLLGLAVPPRASWLRVILAELQRLASHQLWLATHAADAGADVALLSCLRDRERVLDLLAEQCGARLTVRCAVPGGLPRDASEAWLARCGEVAAALPAWVDGYEELLTEDRGFKDRSVGVGVLAAETALAYGVTGPALRAAGVEWDVRKALPYDAYEGLELEVPVERNGDAYDRYRVRIAELRQSARLVLQCLARLPAGPVLAEPLDGPAPAAGAETYFSVEGPRGELGFYLSLTPTPAAAAGPGGGAADALRPWRCHVRSPSFHNLQALPEMIRGHRVADLVVLLGSLDLALGEVDR
jgi:NADH-quinone oxidoreductase subunit D